jgi:hypothetical protein
MANENIKRQAQLRLRLHPTFRRKPLQKPTQTYNLFLPQLPRYPTTNHQHPNMQLRSTTARLAAEKLEGNFSVSSA